MLIDWFTIVAQVLNFLILVWLMKRFLYKPILHAIDEREKRIAAELAQARAQKAEARKERDAFKQKNEAFDRQRGALLSQATDEAQAERRRLLDEARQAADALRAKRQETLINDAHNLNQAITRRARREVFAIARKALTDLATTSLEERLGEVFTRRLRELDGQAKAGLAEALETAAAPALVRSAFDLPAAQRTAIQTALNETFAAEIPVRFKTAPELISGIELTTNGQKVAWSIADYLASLEKGVAELLTEKDTPEAAAALESEAPGPATQGAGADGT
ncbi:MAG: F0F1 ATP synthase subunit delta [Desulfobacterales bacterium]